MSGSWFCFYQCAVTSLSFPWGALLMRCLHYSQWQVITLSSWTTVVHESSLGNLTSEYPEMYHISCHKKSGERMCILFTWHVWMIIMARLWDTDAQLTDWHSWSLRYLPLPQRNENEIYMNESPLHPSIVTTIWTKAIPLVGSISCCIAICLRNGLFKTWVQADRCTEAGW